MAGTGLSGKRLRPEPRRLALDRGGAARLEQRRGPEGEHREQGGGAGEPQGGAEIAELAREVEAQRELVLAEVHARGRLRRPAQRERDRGGVEQRRAAGREALDPPRHREPETRSDQPRALREVLVDAVELRGSPEERELGLLAAGDQGLEGAERAHDLAREAVEHRRGARRRTGQAAAEDAVLAFDALGVGRAEQAILGERLGQRRAGHRHAARGDGLAVHQQAEGGLAMAEIDQQPGAGQIEGGREVAEHEALGFERARLAARGAQRVDQLRNLGARRDRGHHLGAALVAAHDRPVDDDLFEVERDISLHLEGDRLIELSAIGEGEGEAARRDAIRAQGGDHVRGRDLVELHEAADQLRAAGSRRRRAAASGAARRRRRGTSA